MELSWLEEWFQVVCIYYDKVFFIQVFFSSILFFISCNICCVYLLNELKNYCYYYWLNRGVYVVMVFEYFYFIMGI